MTSSAWADRFWSKVQKTETCWHWTAGKVLGYGQISLVGRQRVRAHRAAYEMLVGPIPDGMVLDHLCRNRACVNYRPLERMGERMGCERRRKCASKRRLTGKR